MSYRIFFLIIIFSLVWEVSSSQTSPDKYWIKFTDKNNSPYSLNSPSDYLSSRAIQRRTNQGIPMMENDLPVNSDYIDSLESLGLQILTKSKWLNSVTVYTDSLDLIYEALNFSFVETFQKVLTLKTMDNSDFLIKNENLLSSNQNNNLLNYGYSASQIQILNCHILHNEGFKGEGIHIAILDAGFFSVDTLPAFDSLWVNNRILGVHDFVDFDGSVFEDHSHGMKVLSCLAANMPGELYGTAPEASYWLLRSENGQTEYLIEEDNWVAAAEFADSAGVDILNTSLGYTTFDDATQNHSYSDMDGNTTRITIGSDIAASKGMLVVNSAGNSGNDPWHYIGAPADGDSVLAIGAVDSNGDYAPFSSTGPTYDGRIKPNVAAMGYDVAISSTNGTATFGSGTSFASPILAGAAACLWQAHPQMTCMEIFNIIQESGNQYFNPDSLLGYGIPDFAAAHLILHNIEYTRFKEEAFFRAVPNPFINSFRLEMYSVDSQSVNVEIYNIQGSLIQSKYFDVYYPSFQSETFENLGYLTPGIYIVRITTSRNQYNVKLIKS